MGSPQAGRCVWPWQMRAALVGRGNLGRSLHTGLLQDRGFHQTPSGAAPSNISSPHHITLFFIGQTFVRSDHGYFLSNPMSVQSLLSLSNFLSDQIVDNSYQTI